MIHKVELVNVRSDPRFQTIKGDVLVDGSKVCEEYAETEDELQKTFEQTKELYIMLWEKNQ